MRDTKDNRDDWDGINIRDKFSRVYIKEGSLQPLSSLNLNPKWHNLGKLYLLFDTFDNNFPASQHFYLG